MNVFQKKLISHCKQRYPLDDPTTIMKKVAKGKLTFNKDDWKAISLLINHN